MQTDAIEIQPGAILQRRFKEVPFKTSPTIIRQAAEENQSIGIEALDLGVKYP